MKFAGFLFGFLILISVVQSASNATALTQGAFLGSLKVHQETFYSPFPAEPGRYFDLFVRLQNPPGSQSSSSPITNIVCRIDDAFPFSLDSEAEKQKSIGTMAQGQDVVLKFRMRVADVAVSGNNELPIKCKYSGFEWQEVKLKIFIQARDALLSINSIQVLPKLSFGPAQEGFIVLLLENSATSVLRDITVKLDLAQDFPFAPVESTNEKRITILNAGEKLELKFKLKAAPSAESRIYKLPINITYFDDLGKAYSRSMATALEFSSSPDVLLLLESSEINKAGLRGRVTVSVVNRGLGDAKFVTASIGKSSDFELFSKSEIYLGTINSDDSSSIDLDVFVFNSTTGHFSIPVGLTYVDDFNNEFGLDRNIEVKLYSEDELRAFNIEGDSNLPLIIGGVVGLVALLLLFNFIKWFVRQFARK